MVGSIGGIVSGMDTHSIINQLMQLERMPQMRLQSQRAGIEKVIAAYRGLNTKLAAVGDAAKAMTALNGWQLAKATSTDATRVAVTATAGATKGSLTFAVKSLATAGSAISSGTVSSLDTVVANGPLLLTKGTAALGLRSIAAGTALSAGTHTVSVTQASTAARKSGTTALAASTTVTAGVNDTVRLTVDGTVHDVKLAAGTYDPKQLAAELTRHLGGTATAGVGSDGRLQLTTAAEGSTATLMVGGGGNAKNLALGALGLTADTVALSGTDGRIRLDGDPGSEVTVTSAKAGQQVTLTTASGDSVVATLAGGLRAGDATVESITSPPDATLSQVVDTINASGTGVTAAAIQISPGAYKLQITSTTAGTGSTLSLDPGAFPASLSGLGSMQTLTRGTDAVLTVGTGAGAYEITRPTNTITDLYKGVTLTLAKADPTTPVTIDITTDSDGLAVQVEKMVEAVNAALAEITKLTKYDAETKKGGLLVGDGMLRRIRSDLINSVTGAVAGSSLGSPGAAGVSVQRDGTVKFDKTAFLEAYAKDPAAVQALFGPGTATSPGVAARVESSVKTVTDRAEGLIPGAIKSKESQIRGFTERISSWDNRLKLRELTLQRQFTAMEKALGAAQQQGQWLAGQIAGLPSWGE